MALYSLANAAGAAFRAALNTVLSKLHRNYYGATDPSSSGDSTPGMLWVDTNGANPVLKIRNSADSAWITIGTITADFELVGTTAFARTIFDDADASAVRTTIAAVGTSGNQSITGNKTFSDSARGSIDTLTPGTTVTPNANNSNRFVITLNQSLTIANPTNMPSAGQSIMVILKQDATGSRTVAWGSYWKFPGGTAPTLSTAANSVDVVVGEVISSTEILCNAILNFG